MGGDATGKDDIIPLGYDVSAIMFDRYNVYKIIIYIIYFLNCISYIDFE